ncbi:probable disease resistance protein At4g27220 [Amaranthus tricolor]|uniref:probable disease resistance protein At4g27220 n=1 Tax=Amaranthus tricolor TaxID=29722 RepID=UPI00258E2336|nr:probable disease resistance protein At4g27220 [Amaranthus tricolor]XP_057537079.1 probable disease resistance protein At4g27220 [Amaranthus tricolor]
MPLAAFATPFLTAVGGLVTGLIAAWVREEYVPHRFKERRSNLENLKTKIAEAREMLNRLQAQANGTTFLLTDVKDWMREAEDSLNKVDIENLRRSIDGRCMNGFLPDCCRRCAASAAIEREISIFDQLIEKNRCVRMKPVVRGYQRACNETVVRTRNIDIENIWKSLTQKQNVKVLCIHGIAGVGKTAVAEAIYNQALYECNSFDYVIWVAAEFGVQLKILQEQVARSLNITLPDTSDDASRALKLRDEFVLRKKCLVILDFLWDDYSLQEIGIPESDNGEVVCKVILTSRSRFACPRIVKNEYYEIKPLSSVDTLAFLKRTVGDSLFLVDSEIQEKAIEDCAGLPLAVLILGMHLREVQGQSLDEISIALQERLSSRARSTPSTAMQFERLEYSYKRLEEKYQQCFLYCALYPKGIPIEAKQLIDYWIWEGLLDIYVESLEEKRKLGMKVLKELKDARLLEAVDSNGSQEWVKMLGLLHDMAVNIISKQDNDFFINAGDNLLVLPTIDDQCGKIKRASFMHNQLKAPSKKPNFPNLSTLLLQYNPLDWFSLDFFTGMPKLKVLDLSYTHVSFLPPSACTLKLLQVLLLRHCPSLKHLPDLSNLEELIVLDLFGTPLENLPAGMQRLKKLKRLDLSHSKLTKFPAELVGSLPCLQELLIVMDDAKGCYWRSKQVISSFSRDACVEELACLEGLTILELNFFNVTMFNDYMNAFVRARRHHCSPSFKYYVGGFCTNGNVSRNSIVLIDDYRVNQLPEGTLELYLTMHSQSLKTLKETGIRFQNLKVLNVFDYSGLEYLFSFEMLNCLCNLEKISVRQCWSMKALIRPVVDAHLDTTITLSYHLPRLLELVLIDLPQLNSICSEKQLDWPVFHSFSVWNCEKLTELPLIVSQTGEFRISKKIKIRGNRFWFKDVEREETHSSNYEFEEAVLPENLVSFVSVKTEKLSTESTTSSGETKVFRIFKRKKAEKTRAATILANDDINASPSHSPSHSYITRRLEATSTFIKRVHANVRDLFTRQQNGYASPSNGASSVSMITPTNSRIFLHFTLL